MTRRMGWLVAAAVLAGTPVEARAADGAPALVVRAKALDSLIEDIKYFAGLVGQADAVKQFEPQLRQLPGIDFKKPFGGYAVVSPGIVDSSFAVLIPVTSEKGFLDLLGAFGMNPTKNKDGTYTLVVPQIPFPVHFTSANGYVYATIRDREALAKDKLIAPAKLFTGPANELAMLSLRFDQVPDMVKQVLATQIELNVPALIEQKQPGETEAQHKLKVAAGKEMLGLLTSLLTDCREMRLALELDRKTHKMGVQFSLDAAPKSNLAKTLAEVGKTPSPVAGLLTGEAGLTIGVNQVVPAALAQTLAAALEDSIKEGLSDDAKKLALATRLFKAVEPTVKAGKYQGTLALRGPTAAGRYTGIAGLRVEQGAGLEKALRDLAKELPPEVRQQLTLDHSKLGAFNVHRLTIPANDIPPDGVKILADGSIYAAISNDAIYVALGDTALEALKKAVAGKPGPVPYNLVEASVGKLLGLADDATRAKVQALAKQAFTAKDSDRVRFVVEGGETLKVRLDASTALLTFLGQLGVSSSGQFGSPAKPGK